MISREKKAAFNRMANSGRLYNSDDPELLAYQRELVQKINVFNQLPETDAGLKQRDAILREVLGTYGEGLAILPPVYANFGLKHVHVGHDVFINFNNNFVDDGEIFIGSDTMIGPGCTLATAAHPTSPRLRRAKLQFNQPIHIGENVWIGSGVTVLPGVTIGDNAIIGAGSIVTKDIPQNVIAVGDPARVLRAITANDDVFYNKEKRIPQDIRAKYLQND
ncbi:sugar O-acetyltransferase [Levilactobacillus suantsaii]|uniref:sugar O-acetyltransferase n=1 Tax=Levilactobacillus suantsaii TaxID=2292255 RepID=UPI0015F47A03|nr:sugar O-acetyltransferase [Levilactobacillus suantsaii]QMU07693.1 sugar O-acetyltransferase [Levilactobacillus suantsaii]